MAHTYNNDSSNCTNDYCIADEDYIDMMYNHIYPELHEWILIALHAITFVVGLTGNALVCLAVYRNQSMRTVTNYFIVNLAVADLLVIIFCLPSTVLWDITETWFLGLHLCKVIPYLQTVSVTVSIMTLTFISIDRWYAICRPLKFKSTTGKAKTAIVIIWIVALIFDIPDLINLEVVPPFHVRVPTIYFTQCKPSWSDESQTIFIIATVVLLYAAPIILMIFAYWQIALVLWRSDIPGHSQMTTRNYHSNEFSCGTTDAQLRSRRKAAKMLVAVVLMFAVCYLPIHIFNVLRVTVKMPSDKVLNAGSSITHWMCYANSAVNPVIYNFMSGKFRKEFRKTFCWRQNRRTQSSRLTNKSGTTYSRRLRSIPTIRSIHTNNNVHHSTEVIPLSAVSITASQKR